MKKLIFSGLAAVCMVAGVFAQTKAKPAPKPAAVVAAPKGILKSGNDSLSYAIGVNIANNFKQQGLEGVNLNVLKQAMDDVLKNRKPIMDDQTCNNTLQQKLQAAAAKKQQEMVIEAAKKAGPEKEKGRAFMEKNRARAGVISLPSGLQYEVINEGLANAPKPTVNDTVVVHYTGTLIDGREFDSSVKRGQPAEFTPMGVIRGWTEILQLMPKGAKWKVYIPSDLAYGDRGAGSMIGPGATLIFDIDLIDIKPATVK